MFSSEKDNDYDNGQALANVMNIQGHRIDLDYSMG